MSWNANPHSDVSNTIENDGWWPNVELADFQKSYVTGADFTEAMCVHHLELAIFWVNEQLEEWRNEQGTEYVALADVPAPQIGGMSRNVKLYIHAVSCYAKGILLREFATTNRKDAAKHEGIEAPDAEAKFLQYAAETIADIQKRPRIRAVLI